MFKIAILASLFTVSMCLVSYEDDTTLPTKLTTTELLYLHPPDGLAGCPLVCETMSVVNPQENTMVSRKDCYTSKLTIDSCEVQIPDNINLSSVVNSYLKVANKH